MNERRYILKALKQSKAYKCGQAAEQATISMKGHVKKSTNTKGESREKQSEGFILPLILIVTLIVGAGLAASTTRAWLGLTGAVRQSQARSAREVAEAGLSQLVEALNRNHAHLLVVDEDSWDDPPLFSSICANGSTGVPVKSGTIGNGRYELESYNFNGSPFYGGKADLRMRGEILKSNNSVAAAAIVEQTVEIKAKSCNTSFDEPTTTSGFPGLLAQTVDMGGNDLKGRLSGNLLCMQCRDNIPNNCSVDSNTELEDYSENDKICVVGGNPQQTDVDGEIFLGPIDLPDVPTPPSTMADLYNNPPDIGSSTNIVGGSTESSELLNGACRVDNSGITHCVVNNIDLSGQNTLNIDSSNGPVRIYVAGDNVDFRGQSGITHVPASAPSTNLGLFGREADPKHEKDDQTVILRGRASTNNMWAYFPDGSLGIKGGAQNDLECDSSGECTGGDIYGAVWGKNWGESNGTGAQIAVPADMGQQLYNNFGTKYGIGMKDYVAIGVSKWSSFTIDNQ